MSDEINGTTREIPITRNIDGFTFILQSIHLETVKQLKQQLEEAVEVIEIAQKRIQENPKHLIITQGDLINNKWHERTRQFLAKHRGENE